MPNDDASNVNNNADEDDDRRRRAAASTRPDTHDHTLDRTPRHSLDDVTDDHNGRPGRRRTARLPAVSNHRRLLLSPLWLLIALATMLGLNASSAAAGGGLETRVRAFDHVTVDAVGQPSSERPASVGCLRPSQPGFASGSCVATESGTLFRGTTEGYPGSPGLQRVGVTPASTDPAVATAFGVHGEEFGNGVVHIASPADLAGAKLYPPSLGGLEAEVGVGMTPAEFASSAGTSIPAGQAQGILAEMGVPVPGQLPTVSSLNSWLAGRTSMTPAQVAEFIRRAGGG